MDVVRLRLLRELSERGTVHAVAEAMSLTPSAVSQQLKILRREAGVPLLEPDGRRVRLTDAGRALVGRTDEILAALDRAQADMDAYRFTPRGTVRVAMFPSGAAMLLAGLITRAAAVGVEVLGRDIDQPAINAPSQLADFDVVVVHRDERDTNPWGPRIEATPLLREPLEILLPRHHRLAGSARVPLRELADEPWIGVEGGLMVDDVLRSLATIAGVRPRIVQRVNDFRVVEELVAAGVGIALLPRYVHTTRALVRKPLGGVRIARRIEAVTRAGASARPGVAQVIDILKTVAQDVVGQ
ncbi:LysR family transcriptional regulator [Mycolicibacterium sphagni]|uniref:LysR family transcriptional regulator n=1 Tax=Mycolicibacterium sphagni TaxID=1786 RepID=A0A255DPW2_9MYCO|nr:LysR family transcriptional regulator [Mycolicibacterium sphagni]MCV7177665.1 LysR family transcriptional regulator [Mycolicibacterium sphagni]OYN81130.1 LysR family transcriptional regulator [Mycolicibacterium sphagni]